MKHELVTTWMTKNPITITTTTTLPEAQMMMKTNNIRRLPVVDKQGRLLGIVTYGDIREAKSSDATTLSIWEMNALLNKLKVKAFMTPNPITITPSNTIGEAAELMVTQKISGLPVVDEGQLVGIITESDIFSMVVLHEWRDEAMQNSVV